MAAHPKLSFHNLGGGGNQSQVVIPLVWMWWQPISSCHSLVLDIGCHSILNLSWFIARWCADTSGEKKT
eukprot:4833860-Amphidinium_carterae.1